ncbi:MAG: hypothetical protein KF723_22230 [Rhizobiaceae bacterium]|nr:hypothetical protein [Rhizobiaceae bacterium]
MTLHYVQIRDGVVVNRAVAHEPLPPDWFPEGETWVQSEDGEIGDAYDGKAFTRPPREPDPEPDPPPPDPRDEKIATLEADLAAMRARIDKLDPDGVTAETKTR